MGTPEEENGESTEATSASNSNNANANADAESQTTAPPKKFNRSKRFWAIIATLSIISILSALENTVVTTALPHIVTQLDDLGPRYIWVTNVFFLTGAAVQPLLGQLANIFGRRRVTMAIVALFTVGSAIAGAARNGATLIAGRAVQGMGGGGINIIVDIIVSDLVPLRERGNYIAVILLTYTVGTALGPWVGGAIVTGTSWRWVFWINVPVGGAAMGMIFLFLQVRYNKTTTLRQKLRRIDYIGNVILVGSTVSVLYALTYAGTQLPWSSPRVLAPLIIGLAGLVFFGYFETTPLAGAEPVIPPRLFRSPGTTTVTAIFAATFLNSALLYWFLFFLPVYFQAVKGDSPSRAGVNLLPAILVAIPGAVVAVLLLSKFGRYKPLHLAGFAIATVGAGLFTLLDEGSSKAEYVVYQSVAAVGSGMVLNTLLPAAQAQVAEADQAATTAAWSFVRSFGSIWGVAIPAAVFNNRFKQLAGGMITDPSVRGMFSGAGNTAYERASAEFVWGLEEPSRGQVRAVYAGALKLVWQVSIAFAGAAWVLVWLEKETVLRTELETEYGLEEKTREETTEEEGKGEKQGDKEKEKVKEDLVVSNLVS
ncbi:major facilitator superfamily domain-containing protein [Coniochaeta sp. 2T2.1]|nr:major facilitator superfamily domain-containing protein [Coniochaeta sp. 2T2.1]